MTETLAYKQKSDFLLEKGMEILWSRGYNATSVNDIVKAADVPKGSFYFYFESKEDFAIKALKKYFAFQFSRIETILHDQSISPKERLIKLNEFRVNELKKELQCRMGCMACNLSNEMAEHSENIRKVIEEKGNRFKSEVIKVMKEAQELGEVDKDMDAEAVVEFIEDAGKGAMVTMKEKNSAEPIDNFYKMVRTYFLK